MALLAMPDRREVLFRHLPGPGRQPPRIFPSFLHFPGLVGDAGNSIQKRLPLPNEAQSISFSAEYLIYPEERLRALVWIINPVVAPLVKLNRSRFSRGSLTKAGAELETMAKPHGLTTPPCPRAMRVCWPVDGFILMIPPSYQSGLSGLIV